MMNLFKCDYKEFSKEADCDICDGFYNGLDCKCAKLNKGLREQSLVEKLQTENAELKEQVETLTKANNCLVKRNCEVERRVIKGGK